tara:strand:- start:1111 stop:2148 length:1038 start_codon:yes stop_codon:yes gene_type:complete
MKVYFNIILAVFILSCSGEKEIVTSFTPKTHVLTPERVFEDFGEGVFFTRTTINSDEERIYVANINPAALFILDKDFNLLKLVEERGDGPGALLSPIQIVPTEHGLMVEDRGNYRISIFHPVTGEYLEEINIPDAVSTWRFFYENGEFYFPLKGYQSDSLSVLKVNSQGEPIGKFGALMPQVKGDFNRQARLIQPFGDDKIMLIGINLPYLDILTKAGNHLVTHRLDQFEPLKRALDSLENDFKKPGYERGIKEIKHILIDAQYTGEKLYLTFTDRIGLDRSKVRHMLEISVSESGVNLDRMFRFETSSPDDNLHPFTFHVDQKAGKIYTQGLITQNIYVFNLPD